MQTTPSHLRAALERLESRHLLAVTQPAFVDESFTTGLTTPTAMEFAPDGRLFVAQQGGALRVIQNGTLLANNFVTLTVASTGERGLLGVAFDPNYATNRFVYVYHTVPAGANNSPPPHNRVTRFTADANDPNVAVPNSGLPILDLENLSATNHNGGAIHFGPDGKLYVAVGDNAVSSNAQTLNNRLGKMLRINPDGTIPSDNPFFTNDGVTQPRDYIWALGLRNPFTFAFDPADGTMHINDVGENTWEEINVGRAGANYGWPTVEGPENTPNPNFDDPLFVYNHSSAAGDAGGTVIAGGTFYRRPAGAANPFPDAFAGDYFYADSNRGWVRWLDDNTANTNLILNGSFGIVDLKTGPDGSVYYLTRSSSSVRRLRYTVRPPGAPDLISDTGANTSDNLTSDNTPTFTGSAPANAAVILYDGATQVGSGTASAGGSYSITTSALGNGNHVITAKVNSSGNLSASSAALSVEIDATAPTVQFTNFVFASTPHKLTIAFSEDVGSSIAAGDLSVTNLTTGAAVPASSVSWAGSTATFTFSGAIASGHHRATIAMNDVEDAAGNKLPAAHAFEFMLVNAAQTLQLTPGTRVVQQLAMGTGARLDIGESRLGVDYGTPASPRGSLIGSTYTGLSGLIQSGRNGGAWNGTGIITSAAAAAPPNLLTSIGLEEAEFVLGISGNQTTLWQGMPVDATTVLLKYTYSGDADLNGKVDGDDYFVVDQAMASSSAWGWWNGDFDHNGRLNGDDYFLIDRTIGRQILGIL
ncbi:MAG TPA: PQQ-dependent sugar dehydrogenase [Tepidisphaeraceae bacterium]|nr:PQQ-dependent sugar dehydrogenase [Tepidisphaeraceae bacterium]